MVIHVIGRQMTVRESLRDTIEKKLHKFDKFFDADTPAFVTCKTRKGAKIIEITVTYGGTVFRSEEENETFQTALDRAMETFERQIRKNKTRLQKRVRPEGLTAPTDAEDDYTEEADFKIRVKTFPFKPMTPEEAILQMNLLEHSFFVFTDADTMNAAVVYRRRDGDYGLIMPEL